MFKLKDYKDQFDFTKEKVGLKMSILAKCWDCCCYDRKEVKLCNIKYCPLYPYKEKWLNKKKDPIS